LESKLIKARSAKTSDLQPAVANSVEESTTDQVIAGQLGISSLSKEEFHESKHPTLLTTVQDSAVGLDKDAKKEEKALQSARTCLRALSAALCVQLAASLLGSARGRFDHALNTLEIDDETAQNLKKELQIRPYVDAKQSAKLVAKGFKSKVNSLRSLGVQPLVSTLEELLPSEAWAEVVASAEAAGEETIHRA